MSQASLLSSTPVAPSFPPLVYRNIPVLTTEMLAQAYDVAPKQIRQNFANNRERFIEGKHFFSLSGQELKDFRLCVENFDSQISTKVRVLILYTDRGCARHAKSLNTDRAWDMYELLEETFFAVKSTSPQVFLSTPADRKPLRSLVNAWAKLANVHQSTLWPQVRAHFQLERIDDLPVEWLPDALAWVQGKIDELSRKPLEMKAALPAAPQFDEASLLELAEDIRTFQQGYRRSYQLFWGRLYQLGTPVLVQLEQRAALGQGTAPFSDMTIRGQFDRFLSERLLESLSSLAEPLPDRHNPAMLLLACARAMSAR